MSIGIATLSETDIERHIILGLTHSSPISIFKMCDAGYKAVFTYTNIYIIKDEKKSQQEQGKNNWTMETTHRNYNQKYTSCQESIT